MSRRAEIELLARLLLAAALLGVAWLIASLLPWTGSSAVVLALLVIAPAVAAARQPVLRLILAIGLGIGVPAVALGQEVWLRAVWLVPAALIGMPLGVLLRRALDRVARADADLPRALASAAAIVMAYPVAGLIAWGMYLAARHLVDAPVGGIAPLASCAAAISGAAYAWPWRKSGEAEHA